MMEGGIGMGFGGGLMWLFWIVSIVLVVWAIKLAIGVANRPGDKARSALDILEERYAKGEIDQEEFEQKRKALSE
ncbi:SHOCT domain-containing protein [Sedimenticola selenatireducens]|uniref:SHOCT domain-containing protein n=1 Tax=Sedimenticola selenatireducens TaxID=191960 RepID=UPI0004B3CD7F|nr:SHOCT domain-containing protein [Sedimenticola selenatireducens]